MANSQSKRLVKRICPECGETKSFPLRNDFCSVKCADDAKIKHGLDRRGLLNPTSETQEVIGNTLTISLPNTRISTLEELIAHCKIDLEEWTVERFVVNKWEMGRRDKSTALTFTDGVANGQVVDSGRVYVEPLFQVKATLVRKAVQISVREELAAMMEEAKRQAPTFKAIKRTKSKGGNMLELSIPDLHLGKMAWAKQTGHADYDVRIAERAFEDALTALLERTSSYQFDEICFVIGNDLLQTDNTRGTTTAGTPVASDSRYHRSFRIARQMITRAIERLREIAPVQVYVVPGNHDELTAWHMGESLECYFHKAKDVTIHNDPTSHKIYQWGKVLLMFAHGDAKGKLADYPIFMATEHPKLWSESVYREIHTGHLHQVRLEEKYGVRIRILPSLSAEDDWHSKNHFVGNIRSAEAYVWNRECGLLGTAVFSVQ